MEKGKILSRREDNPGFGGFRGGGGGGGAVEEKAFAGKKAREKRKDWRKEILKTRKGLSVVLH